MSLRFFWISDPMAAGAVFSQSLLRILSGLCDQSFLPLLRSASRNVGGLSAFIPTLHRKCLAKLMLLLVTHSLYVAKMNLCWLNCELNHSQFQWFWKELSIAWVIECSHETSEITSQALALLLILINMDSFENYMFNDKWAAIFNFENLANLWYVMKKYLP